LNLSEEINNALLHHDGLLGTLISAIENLEEEKYDLLKDCLGTLNVDLEELFRIENNAIIEYENMNGDNNQ
jgi:c-di-GMP-related signal transduction protein